MIVKLFKNAKFSKAYPVVYKSSANFLSYLNGLSGTSNIVVADVYFDYEGQFNVQLTIPLADLRAYNYGICYPLNSSTPSGMPYCFFIDYMENAGVAGLQIVHYTLDVWHTNQIVNGINIRPSPLKSFSRVVADSQLPIKPIYNGFSEVESKNGPFTRFTIEATLSIYKAGAVGAVTGREIIQAQLELEWLYNGNLTSLDNFTIAATYDLLNIIKRDSSAADIWSSDDTGNYKKFDVIDIKILGYSLSRPSITSLYYQFNDYYQSVLRHFKFRVYSIPTSTTQMTSIWTASYNVCSTHNYVKYSAAYYGLFGLLKKCKLDNLTHNFGLSMAVEDNKIHIYFNDEDGIQDVSELFEFKDGIVPDSAVALATKGLEHLSKIYGGLGQALIGGATSAASLMGGNIVGTVGGVGMAYGGMVNAIAEIYKPAVSNQQATVRSLSPILNAINGLSVIHCGIINENEIDDYIKYIGYLTDSYLTSIPTPTSSEVTLAICFKNAIVYGLCQKDCEIISNILNRGTILVQ